MHASGLLKREALETWFGRPFLWYKPARIVRLILFYFICNWHVTRIQINRKTPIALANVISKQHSLYMTQKFLHIRVEMFADCRYACRN